MYDGGNFLPPFFCEKEYNKEVCKRYSRWRNKRFMNQLGLLKMKGVDFDASKYDDDLEFMQELSLFIRSYEFMRLGQSINHKQWQAAAMKVQKMTQTAKNLGMTGWEHLFTGIRQNINRKNDKEALQILSVMITKRVQLIELLNKIKIEE